MATPAPTSSWEAPLCCPCVQDLSYSKSSQPTRPKDPTFPKALLYFVYTSTGAVEPQHSHDRGLGEQPPTCPSPWPQYTQHLRNK